VALVLGKAVLWLIYYSPYDATYQVVPQDFKTQIRLEWNKIVSATVVGVDCDVLSYYPIRRVPVVVTGDQGCVHIDVVPSLNEAGGDEEGAAIFRGAGGHAAMATITGGLTAQLLAVRSLAIQIWRERQEL
jgi:hypothetical protein